MWDLNSIGVPYPNDILPSSLADLALLFGKPILLGRVLANTAPLEGAMTTMGMEDVAVVC